MSHIAVTINLYSSTRFLHFIHSRSLISLPYAYSILDCHKINMKSFVFCIYYLIGLLFVEITSLSFLSTNKGFLGQNRRDYNRNSLSISSSKSSNDNTGQSLSIRSNSTDLLSSIENSLKNAMNDSTDRDKELIQNHSVDNLPAPFTITKVKFSHQSIEAKTLQQNSSNISFKGPSSYQVRLDWETPPKRVLFLVKKDADVIPYALAAMQFLLSPAQGLEVYVESNLLQTLIEYLLIQCEEPAAIGAVPHPVQQSYNKIKTITETDYKSLDFVITFGGDGLLLHCNSLFGDQRIPPICCFDFGSLGFLAPFRYSEFNEEIKKLTAGSTYLTLRMRLECKIYRDNKLAETFHVLNEAVIDRGSSPFLSAIDLECDDEYITTVQGDGVIIATPTGSTAYSLAAGGSMVHPSVPAILLTPICPHTLSFRPLLLPDSSVLSCKVPMDARNSAWVAFDGKFKQELQRGDRIDIRMSSHPVPTINRLSFTGDWFTPLRSQFMFNLRPKQKGIRE